jgi:phosphopantothenoylcysteine decarboxylase/phosphopantothenate--cysteine ligase
MEAQIPDQTPNRPGERVERGRRILITAGPTQEPIDAVRYIGNRSSGRLGLVLANEALRRGWNPTILLGPVSQAAVDSGVRVRRFRTTADLQALLNEEVGGTDLLVMAAAVADYRPIAEEINLTGKRRRSSSGLSLKLEATPDLLAGCHRRPGQVFVGFALEPAEELMSSARHKLRRKRVDLIVANPLETMDAEAVSARLYGAIGEVRVAPPGLGKDTFAAWLFDALDPPPHRGGGNA